MVIMESSSMTIHEEDVIKLILEFLSTRHYHVTMRTLEKESGVINCDYSDEVLFLRDLVMDGDFEEIIQFGNSFMGSPTFNQKRFNFLVLKQKYIELIYTKSHIIGKQTYNIVEDVMKTLSELKCYCSTKDEYSDFCWLLTVPNLNSLDQFKNWSLDLSRLRCFEELLDCLSSFMPLVKKKISSRHISTNDRLLHLLVKGLFYESCIEYCQAIGSGDSEGLCNNDLFKRDLLKSKFDDYSSNLLSWILCLPHEAFVTPFQQMDVDIRFTRLVKKANITNSLDVTSVLKTKTSSTQLSQSLPDQASVKKKNYESLNKNYEILNKNNESITINKSQEPLNQTFTQLANNDVLNKKNENMNLKNASLHSNGVVSGVGDVINEQDNSLVPKQTNQKKSVPSHPERCPTDASNKINNVSMNMVSDNHAGRKEKKNGDNQTKADKNIPLHQSQKGDMDNEDCKTVTGELKLDCSQQSAHVTDSGSTTPSHPNLSFFIPMDPVAQQQQLGEENKTHPQPTSASTPKSITYTKDMKPDNPTTVMSKTGTYTKHARGETKPDIAPTYTKETLPDFNSREVKSEVAASSILPEDKSGVTKSPLTPSITTSPGLSRKKKSEFFPQSNRSSMVRTSTSAKETKKSPGEDIKPAKKVSSDGQKDQKKSSVGEMQRKRSDSIKDSKKLDNSPKKTQNSADDDSHSGSNIVTSTPKSKRNDRSSFPPISPLKKKTPENEEKPVVDGPAGDVDVRGDVKDDIGDKDLPIGYYELGKENNLPNQSNLQLGPVINGVRRPISNSISKTLPQQPSPQVNADELQDKIHHFEQPPEQLAPTQPVLKGAGPKIKMKDGSKVHLKELMKAKDMPTDTGNYQLPASMSSEMPISNENNFPKHADDIKLSYTIERNEPTKIVDDKAIYKTDEENVIKPFDERSHNRNDMTSEIAAKSKDNLTTKRSNELKLSEEEKILKYAPISILEDTQAVRAVSFHPEGGIYAIGANSKMLRICDMAMNGTNRENDGLPPMTVLFKRCKYHRGSIYCMDWSPDGRLLATGSNDKSIKILQFDAHQFTQTGEDIELNFHSGTVRELAFVPNKSGLLISGGTGDGSINITDTITQKIVGTLNGHTGNVMSVYAGVDLVATGGTDNAVRLWDLRSRRCIDVVIVGESCPASVTLSGSDKYLASGQEDGSILLYDLTAGRTLENFRLHQSDCRSVRFSMDSNYLLTSSYDCNVTLMHLLKKTEMASPRFYNVAKHSDKVIQCRWHPAENMFLSSSADKTSVLWKSIT